MRYSVAAAVVLAIVPVVAGCGADEQGGATLPPVTTARVPAASATAPPDEARLRAALLGVSDLPAGFAAVPDPERDLGLPPAPDAAASSRSTTDPTACASVLAEVADQVPGASARAAARFAGPDFAGIDTDAAGYSGSGAVDAFGRIQQTLTGCGTYSGTDADGVPVTYRLGGLDQHAVGDASVAVRLVTTSEGVTMVSDAVIAVVGGVVVQVVASGQRPVDPTVVAGLARTAVDRLRLGAV